MPRAKKRYPNRSDLAAQPVKAAPSQQYGQAAASEAAQQAIPLPAMPSPQALPRLDAPSARPDEPVTAGVPIGAGPNRPTLPVAPIDTTGAELRAIYAKFPTPDLLALIAQLEE